MGYVQAGPTIKPGNTKKAHVQAARHAEEEEAVAAKRKAAGERLTGPCLP